MWLVDSRGAKVASIDLSVMRVFFQTAPLVYCTIVRQSAECGTGVQISALGETQLSFTAAKAGDVTTSSLLNHEFHEQIGQMA